MSIIYVRRAHIQHTHIYCKDMIQLLRTYTSVWRSKSINFDFLIDLHTLQIHTLWRHDTERQQRLCVHALQLIYNIYTVIAKARLSFCTHTHLCNAVNQSISIFWSIYIHRKYIHCKNMTQTLLIYTEQQQRLCACAATYIHHTHTHCKDTTQLLHIYTLV